MTIREDIKEILQTPDVIKLDIEDMINVFKKYIPKVDNSKNPVSVGFNRCRSQIISQLSRRNK